MSLSITARNVGTALALFVLLSLVALYGCWAKTDEPTMTPEEAAYAALVAEHPLTSVVEAVESASPYATVVGYEFVTNTINAKTTVALWAFFDQAGTEDEFVALHRAALQALVEAFPNTDMYLLVWAVYDAEGDQVRGMSAMSFTSTGASIALQHSEYRAGVQAAFDGNEAGNIAMGDFGYPALEDPWYPRPEGYEWPWDTGTEEGPSTGPGDGDNCV